MPNKKKLYEALKAEGYDNFADESSFNAYVDNADNRKKLFSALKQEGYDNFADETEFEKYLGYNNSEDDAVFEANAERFRNGQPIERVTTQSVINANPELGLQTNAVQPEAPKWNVPQYDWRTDQQKKFDELSNSTTATPVQDQYGNEYYPVKPREVAYDEAVKGLKDISERKAETKSRLQTISNDVSNELNRLQSQVEVSDLDKFRPANLQSMPVNPVNQELMPEYTALRKAQRLVEESNNIIEEASKKGNTNFMAGLARGFWDNLNAEDYTFGADDAAQSAFLYRALDKAEKGESLTKAEETLLDAAAINMAVQSYYAQDLGKGYGAGQVTAESIPFMLEMAINPISASGKTTAKALLNYGLKKFAKNKAAKVGARLAGDALAATGMAATTGFGDVLEGTTNRLAQNYNYQLDDEGRLHVEKKDDTLGMGEAFARSFATRAIENQSEMIFKAFEPIGGFMKGVQDILPGGVNKFFEMLGNNKVADAYRAIKNSPVFRNYLVKDIRNATQIGGLGEEYLEEVYNNLANAAIGEMKWEDVVSLDKNIDTLLGLAPTQVMFGLLGLGGAGAMRYQTRKTLEDLQATMNEQQRKDLEGLLDMGLDAKEVDVRGFIRNVMQNESYTIENKRDLIKAAYNVAKQNGIDELTEADTIDKVNAENALIDSVTDPSTGIYTEITATLPDAKEGTIEVPGYVVGWLGEGEKRQPIFVQEGMENTYENRRVLKPGQWSEEAVQQMPAEEVKAISEEMIREEAAQQAEQEAKYAPEVLNAQIPEGEFTMGGQLFVPSQVTSDGVVYDIFDLNEKGKPTTTIPIESRPVAIDEYRDMLQAQLNAEEAAQGQIAAEEQAAAPEVVEEAQPTEEVRPSVEGVANQPQAAQPKQPTLEDVLATLPKTNKGEIDYKAMTPQQQYQYTSITESPEVALEDLQADIAAGQEEIAKKQEKLAKAIGGERAALRDKVRKLTQAQAELQAFYESVAPKQESVEETTQPVEEAVTEPTVQAEVAQPQAEATEEQTAEQPSKEMSAPEVATEQSNVAPEQTETEEQKEREETSGPVQTEPLQMKEGESALQFAERAAEENDRRTPLRKRAEEWAESGVEVVLHESIDSIENQDALDAINSGKIVPGWYDGKAHVFLPHVHDTKDLDKTIIHEAVAHKGLRGLLTKEQFNSLCDKVWDMMSNADRIKYLNYPGVSQLKNKKKTRAAADEYMAHLAEDRELTSAERSTWEKIVQFVKDLLGIKTDNKSQAAGIVNKSSLNHKDLADLILLSYQEFQQKKKDAVERLEENVGEVDAEKGDVRFAVRDVLKGEERAQAIKDLMAVTGRSKRTVEKWLKAEESLASVILNEDNVGILDMEADESVPSIWKNSDYPQGTVEFSNICKKRLPFTTIYQRLQKEFPDTLFDAQTLNTIRNTMKEMGEDVACALCFVEDRRQLLGEIGQGFIDAVKGMDVELNDNQKVALDKLRESGDKYVPNLFDIITLDGMKELRKKHPAVAQAFIEYNNARGMQSGRLFQAYSAYNREILKYNKKKVESINNNGGLRIFSFSDFEAHHLIDLVQVLTDCAAKGIKVQGYTKVPEFAKAVKDTNAKINRSLIPKGVGYVDADYTPKEGEAVSPNVINGKRLLFDTIEGIDANNPNFFDSTNSKSVGNILVAINDEHARLAMADPFVDYIIGFHTGQSKAILKGKGIDTWVNYKNEQLDKEIVTDEKGNQKMKNAPHHGLNIYTDVLNVAESEGNPIKTAKQFTERFIDECNKRGWIPRFHRFLNRAKDGRFLYTPGYHKFLIDFKLFDKNGKILPQEAVVPVFDNEFNKQILDNYVKGVKEEMPNDAVYEAVKEAIGLGEGTKFRVKFTEEEQAIIGKAKADGTFMKAPNGEPTNLTEKQWAQVRTKAFKKWFGDWENDAANASKVVDENGEPMVMYHGTNADFTEFDINKFGQTDSGSYGKAFYFTARPERAKRYGKNLMPVFVDARNLIDGRKDEALGFVFGSPTVEDARQRLYDPTDNAMTQDEKDMAAEMITEELVEEAKKYDGVDGSTSRVRFEELTVANPNQIKSATDNVGTFDDGNNDSRFRISNQNQEIFVSNAQKAVEGIKQEKATPQQWLAMIEKNGGLKAGEDKWLGLSDWLKDIDKKSVSKDEILEFIDQNKIVIEEVKYGEYGYFINDTRLDYTTKGLENKAEIALTVPTIEPWNVGDEIHFGDAGEGRAIAWIRFGETTIEDKALTEKSKVLGSKEWWSMSEEERKSIMDELKNLKQNSRSTRVLVIDEIQSKRHQEGREKGYVDSKELDEAIKQNKKAVQELREQIGSRWLNQSEWTSEESSRFDELSDEYDALLAKKRGIPEAPFEKNWSELAFKRMLRYAAENGFDKVAWTTGAQQAERYSLSNVIDSISISKSMKADGKYHITSWDKDTMPIGIASGNKTPEELKALFGKEIAQSLIEGVDNLEEGSDTFVLEGASLEVGGEGMKGFYDKMLPSFVNKYVKKWGAKVQDIELPNVEESGRIMHSVDVTEAMKESVMEGQTMFRISEKGKQIQTEVDKFTSKYASRPVLLVENSMSDEEKIKLFDNLVDLETIHEWLNVKKAKACIVKDNGKIYIFADNISPDDVELSMFHENLHAFIADYRGLMDKVWERMKDIPSERLTHVKAKYKEEKWKEEFFVYTISLAQKVGYLGEVKPHLDEAEMNELIGLLNKYGYDYEKEYDERRRARTSKLDGQGRSEDRGRVRTTGSGTEELLREQRERKARLNELFNKVADMGLQGVLGNKEYTSLMVDIYKALPEEVRAEIAEDALRLYGGSVAPAVSDYIGPKSKNSIMDKVVTIVREALRKIGFDLDLNANEVRYMAWRSKKPLDRNNMFEVAEDIDMKYRLKVGEYDGTTPDGGGTRFRVVDESPLMRELESAYKAYDKKKIQTAVNNIQEAILDGEPISTGDIDWESVEDYNGESPKLLAAQYIVRSQHNIYLEKDTDQEYIRTGIKSSEYKKQTEKVDEPKVYTTLYKEKQQEYAKQFKDKVLESQKRHRKGMWLWNGLMSEDEIKQKYQSLKSEYERLIKAKDYENAADILGNLRAFKYGFRKYIKDADIEMPTSFDLKEGTRFRVENKLQVRDEYEATIKKGGYQAREAVQDAMLSLRKFQELIEKASGKKIRDFENAWMHENRLSSVVQAEIHDMERKFYKPMMDAVKKVMKVANIEQEQVADYLMLKHGIERNREMAVRKALTDDKGKIDRTRLEQWYQDKRNVRNRAATPHLDTWRKQQEELDNIALLYGADMSRDYSGLTSMFGTDDLADSTQKAYDEVEALENAHPVETESLGKAIKAMTQNTLDKSFESGLMDRKVYDELSKDMYDYYIPLRGFEETTSEEVYAYLDQDRGAFNAPLKRAKGRSSKSDNPIAYLKSIAESGIMQGNRNKMMQSFLNMVINNPSDLVSVREGVWVIYNPASGEWEAASAPAIPNNATPADVEAAMEAWEQQMEQAAQNDPNIKKVSEAADVPYRVVGNRMDQHQIIVKRLGKSYTLTINGNPRLAMAINGQTNPNNTSNDGKVAAFVNNKIGALNRSLAAWYTTRNPDFVASNFMRDTFYTNTIVRAKEGNAYANKFHKNYANVLPKMLGLFRKYENGTLNPADQTDAAFLDFMMNGGETGYSNLKDVEEIKKQITKALKESKWDKAVTAVGLKALRRENVEALAEKLDILNRAVENTARFAAFLTSREEGRSIAKSVFDAKEISVNFNKKGAGGTFFGMTGQTWFGNLAAMVGASGRALYVFFNAAIQGTTNLMHVMKVNPKGTSAGLAAMFLMGAVVPFLFDDDDDEKDYFDLPEHVRRNHLIIPGAGDAWISIPLPIEYRIMYGMGELLTSWRTGHERGSDIARKMLSMSGQALPLNFLEEGLEAFVPSAVSPIYQVMTNSSWTGLPIYKENDFNKDDPEYTKAYSNVDRNLLKFTKALYEWTFDEENQKERIDLNPAIIETLAKGYFGGLATQLSNIAKVGGMIAGEQEFDWRNIPIGNRILKTGDERTKEKRVTNEYFENMEKLDFLQSRERMLKKTEKGVAVPEADKFKAQKDLETMQGTEVYKKYQEFKKQKKVVDKIRKTIKEKGSTPEREKQLMEAQEKANKSVR